jgi:DNA-binding IclR family transcriptional regulator
VLTKLSRNPEAKKFIETKSGYFSRVLCEVRQKGYALVDEEFIRGVRGIAAPIFNFKGEIEAAINIPVFAGAISRKKLIKEFLPLLKDAAEKISIARGYTPQLSPGIGGAEESQVNSKPVRQNKK